MRRHEFWNTLRACLLYLPVLAALTLEKLSSGACARPQQALALARQQMRCPAGRQFARHQRRLGRTR